MLFLHLFVRCWVMNGCFRFISKMFPVWPSAHCDKLVCILDSVWSSWKARWKNPTKKNVNVVRTSQNKRSDCTQLSCQHCWPFRRWLQLMFTSTADQKLRSCSPVSCLVLTDHRLPEAAVIDNAICILPMFVMAKVYAAYTMSVC